MKIILLAFSCLLFLTTIGFAQKYNKRAIDPKNQKEMLVGLCNRHGLESAPFSEWFNKEYTNYQPDTLTLDLLKDQMKGVRIVLVMASWCGDSRREVPRFYKILDYLDFKAKRMKVISTDREKKAGKVPVEELKIQLVPTFVIYKNDKELGRIIESPAVSLEKDLLKILSNK